MEIHHSSKEGVKGSILKDCVHINIYVDMHTQKQTLSDIQQKQKVDITTYSSSWRLAWVERKQKNIIVCVYWMSEWSINIF